MVSNPMQRKSRNSFLLGIVITLLITGVVIALLLLQLKNKSEELNRENKAKVAVYTLTQDVKAGQVLTKNMFQLKRIDKDSIPSNATATAEVVDTWFLQTKDGEMVCRDKYGLYLERTGDKAADTIIEVRKNVGETIQDSKGNKIQNGDYYVEENDIIEKVTSLDGMISDDNGIFYVDIQGNDKKTRIYQEDVTGEFYAFKIDVSNLNAGNTKERGKEYIAIKNVPVLARVNMYANTVITPELIVQSNEIVTDDTRQEEYNMVVLPTDLMVDEYIDIRLLTPSGQNFIVVSKARVEIPRNADGSYIPDTVKVNLREDEILAMSSAIVETYGLEGAKLYANKYVEPAMQGASLPTYTPNAAVTALIQSNPNIVEIAKEELATRYSDAAKKARNDYLQQVINETEDYMKNIKEGMEEDIATSITTRKKYLDSIQAARPVQ